MKQVLLAGLMLTLASLQLQSQNIFTGIDFKKTHVKVKPDLLVGRYEVSNLDYRNFLTDLANNKQEKLYAEYLPGTLVWRDTQTYNEPFVQFYFREPAYNNYPVVGVSYEAANEYCNWLTNQYNQNPKRKYKSVRFKLPTKEEWIFAAQAGDTGKAYTWGSGFMQNNRKQYLCNFKHTNFVYDSVSKKYTEIPVVDKKNPSTEATITSSVQSYYPNSFGIYNMCGNVAEMVAEKGIVKGGSFNDPAYKVRILSENVYTKQQADIGFRVAVKIIEE